MTTGESQILVDALPYTDSGYDEPGVKQAAMLLVEEECRRYKPAKHYLEACLGPADLHAFETELLRNEFERMEQCLPLEALSMKRYELPPPPQQGKQQSEAASWLDSVNNSCAQLEHQSSRVVNLELMAEHGPISWRIYVQTLKTMLEQADKQLDELKANIQQVNLARKNEQSICGDGLHTLQTNWTGLVGKNYEIECAVVELEKELKVLRKREVESLAAAEASTPKEIEAEKETTFDPREEKEEESKKDTTADAEKEETQVEEKMEESAEPTAKTEIVKAVSANVAAEEEKDNKEQEENRNEEEKMAE